MSDNLTKAELIAVMEEHRDKQLLMSDYWYGINWAINTIRTADITDRPQGEWIEHHKPFTWMGFTYWTCSECGYGENNQNWIQSNFCPNCGARMIDE